MPKKPPVLRDNQRHRTRKDLLSAAGRLLKQGLTPDMDDVAREALVSRATAYRYFPTIDDLMLEAPLDGVAPAAEDLFAHDTSTDPASRIERAENALHDMTWRNEPQLRLMLAATLARKAAGPQGVPVRQNRRGPLIAAALAPARGQLTDAAYEKLAAALALIFGTEAMIVFQDVLGIDEKMARKVKTWAARSLVETALRESAARH